MPTRNRPSRDTSRSTKAPHRLHQPHEGYYPDKTYRVLLQRLPASESHSPHLCINLHHRKGKLLSLLFLLCHQREGFPIDSSRHSSLRSNPSRHSLSPGSSLPSSLRQVQKGKGIKPTIRDPRHSIVVTYYRRDSARV